MYRFLYVSEALFAEQQHCSSLKIIFEVYVQSIRIVFMQPLTARNTECR